MDTTILQAIQENTAAMNRLISLMEAKETQSEWVDPEEAARILGINVTKGNHHRRRINAMVQRGIVTTFIEGRPFKYLRTELEKVAAKRMRGEIEY